MGFEEFEWDTEKCFSNVEKHGIDFEDATAVFDRPFFVKPARHQGEHRWLAFGDMEGCIICVV